MPAFELDTDSDDSRSPVAHSIVLCGSQDDGVDAAEAFERDGVAVPRAYFDPAVAEPLLTAWGLANLDEYVTALHERRSTEDGVFALVLRWSELRRLHRQAAGLRQMTAERLLEIVEFVAPRPSFARLCDTGASTTPRDGADATTSRFDRTTRLHAATDAVWDQWFDAIGVTPLEIPLQQVRERSAAVLDAIGAPATGDDRASDAAA